MSFQARQAHAIATDLATHHRLCNSHKGSACDCYAKAGSHALAFAYLVAEDAMTEAAEWLESRPDRTEGDAATASRLRSLLPPAPNHESEHE